MININEKINENLKISKSFILNMSEIDYDKLIDFLQDMKDKNEKVLQIDIESSSRKWFGYSKGGSLNDNKYNKTDLSK